MSRFQLPAVRRIFWFILAIVVAAVPYAPANAADSAAVRITSLEITEIPSFDTEGGQQHLVILRGTYTNLTNATIANLKLNLVTSQEIRTRSELAEILGNQTNVQGLKVSDQSAKLANIPQGATRTWQISFRGEPVLGLNAAGVFAFGVTPDEKKFGAGSAVTTPWFFNADIKPTEVALVVPLTTLNSHLANGDITAEEQDLAEAKRISALLQSQTGNSISWLPDSGLHIWATQLANQSDSTAVKSLVESLAVLPGSTPVLPFGNADLSALVRSNQQDSVRLALNQSKLLSEDRQIYYSPASGSSDNETLALLSDLSVRSLVSNKFIRGNERETTPAVVTASSNSALVFDLAASSCLISIDLNDESFFNAVTCIKSEIGMMTAESPQKSRSVIVLAPKDWKVSSEKLSALISALGNHNWMRLTSLDVVAATTESKNYIPAIDADQREISRSLLRQSRMLQVNADSVAAMYDDPELAAGFEGARTLGFSELWPTNTAANQYLTENLDLLNEYLNAVQIESSARITTPEEISEIPITIVNESDKTISVSVLLTSDATSRFSAQPTGLIQVEAGQRVTTPVEITLVGAGIVDVQAHLVAPNGERFGEVKIIQISSAAYGQFARTLVLGAFGLLILLSLSNVVKRRRGKLINTKKS